jgi:hypothetical protein
MSLNVNGLMVVGKLPLWRQFMDAAKNEIQTIRKKHESRKTIT